MPRLLPLMILPLSIAFWMSALTGCRTKFARPNKMLILPADKVVVPLPVGSIYTNALPGYFVPKERMLEILNRLSEKDVFGGR
jgi:hypothetical protein